MTRQFFSFQEVGLIELYLEAEAIHPDELRVTAVYENERGGDDLLLSNKTSVRLIAAAVADEACRDAQFISRLWTNQCEREAEERGLARETQADFRRDLRAEAAE